VTSAGNAGKAGDAFERIVGALDYPMFVLTVTADGERSGCLVGFAAQCSINPPRFFVWVSKKNHTSAIAARADVFVLHALREHDRDLAHLFGELTGDDVDKFERCDWEPGPGETPVLTRCDWFAGRVIERTDSGDHVGYLLEVVDGGSAEHSDDPQLGFQAVKDFDPGHDA
jgi:flavin reductase (DIM6/NTAB) family NADH-FMN oxidoreductase RutF